MFRRAFSQFCVRMSMSMGTIGIILPITCIHTNDTHPAMCGPELMRLLLTCMALIFDQAFKIASASISIYQSYGHAGSSRRNGPLRRSVICCLGCNMFIEEVDRRYRENLVREEVNADLLASTAILWDGRVRMANLSIIFKPFGQRCFRSSHQHSEQTVLRDFYRLRPEIFNNKTNGVCHRRFLAQENPPIRKAHYRCHRYRMVG